MKETDNRFARWLIISSVSFLIGFVILTRPLTGDFNRILAESGIDKELRISYLVALAVLLIGTIWSVFSHSKIEMKILGTTSLIVGLLLTPMVLTIVKQ